MKIKKIEFDVQDYFDERLDVSARALSFTNALLGVELAEKEFKQKVLDEEIQALQDKQERIIKDIDEIEQNEIRVTEINKMLEELGSRLRLKQYIFTDQDINLNYKIMLINNGCFRWVLNLDDIVIPARQYCSFEFDDIDQLNQDCLYIFDESGNEFMFDLYEDINCNINYETSYLNIILQVLQKQQVVVRHDCYDFLDIYSDDKKIDASISINDVVDLFLLANNQKRVEREYVKFEICMEELGRIKEQI